MRRNTLVRSSGLKKNSHPKNTVYRSLRMESLEKRELLSAVPADNFSLQDENGCLTQGGTLVYTVTYNETANPNTRFRLGDGEMAGVGDSISVEVKAGDAMPQTEASEGCKTQVDEGPLGTIRVEDWTDDDYNDLVVEITFIPDYAGTPEPSVCTSCSCSTGIANGSESPSDPSGNLAVPKNRDYTCFRVESSLLALSSQSASQPQMMTAVLQMGNLTKSVVYGTSEYDSSEKFAIGMNLNTTDFESGRYEWTMTLTYNFGNDVTQTGTFSGHKNIVNLSESPYGNGINAAGLSSLNLTNFNAATERGINWERSCGKQVWFAFDGTDFTPQAGESFNSSLIQNLDGSFTLEDQGETFLFNASGKLLTRTDNLTNAVTIWTYNVDGTAATKTDGANRVTTYGYMNGMLSTVTDFAGRVTSYNYDSLGRLTSVTEPDPDGLGTLSAPVTTYTYDGTSSRVATITDASGNVTAYTYREGQVVSKTVNGVTQFMQDPFVLSAVVDTTVTGYDSDHLATLPTAWDTVGENTNVSGNTTQYRYNANGNVVWQKTSGGMETFFVYDTADRRTSVTNALNQTTTYTYDNLDRLVSTTYASGQSSQNIYNNAGQLVQSIDLNGAVTSYTYNTSGKVASVTSPGSSVSYTYDSLGRILTETDSLNRVTAYTYNAGGKLASTTISDGTQSAVISQTTYDAWGRTATQTDAADVVLAYTYDKFDRVTKITRTNDNVVLETRTYDEVGNLKTTKDSLNRVTTHSYDALGNLTQVKSADNSMTRYTYDKLGRVLTQTDALNRVTSYTYDTFGNVSAITQANNSTYTYNYNAAGQLLSQTDPLGTITLYTYDLNGQVTQTEFRDKNLPKALETRLDTAQTFDGVDDSVTIPNTNSLNFTGEITLSAWVKVESATGFRGIVEHGFYSGREVYLRIANGKYQAGSNNGTDHYAEATVDSADIGTWVHLVGTYDGTNWNLYKNGVLATSTASSIGAVTVNCEWLIGASKYPGRFFKGEIREAGIWNTALTAAEAATLYEEGFSDVTIQSTATYDAAGNLLTQTDGMGNTTSYTYDNMGRVATMTDALNNVTSYTYDKLGRLLTTTDARGTVTRNLYDAVGNLLETRQYDGTILPTPVNSWLSDGQDFNGTSDSVNLSNDSSLNFEGEITVSAWVKIDTTGGFKAILAHGSAGGKEVYLRLNGSSYQFGSWDSATDNHLVSASIPAADIGTWVHLIGTYDENGNRITANDSSYTTSTNNELTSDGAWSYVYDDEGNRISKTNSAHRELYEWDYRNRLTSVTQQEFNTETQEWTTTQTIEYTYDYTNVWIRKVNGSNSTIFIPENYQTTVQIDNNTVSHHYLWTPQNQDKLLATPQPMVYCGL